VALQYEKLTGMQWHNTRRYAHMSDTELANIRTQPCGCHIIDDRLKEGGHLRTSDPHVCLIGAHCVSSVPWELSSGLV